MFPIATTTLLPHQRVSQEKNIAEEAPKKTRRGKRGRKGKGPTESQTQNLSAYAYIFIDLPNPKLCNNLPEKVNNKSAANLNMTHLLNGVPSTSSSPDDDTVINDKFTFKISSVKNPTSGHFFRIRSNKQKYIKLKTFLNRELRTFIFKSNFLGLTGLTIKLENLKLADTPRTTKKSRKYFDGVQSKKGENKKLIQLTDSSRVQNNGQIPQTSKIVTPTKSKKENGKTNHYYRRKRRHNKETVKNENKDIRFLPYCALEDAIEGEKNGTFIRGTIRINPKNSRDSYISNSDSTLADYYITSILDRNRALDGDEVLFKIKPKTEWSDGKKTIVVVYILREVHPRTGVGCLKPSSHPEIAKFHPRDKRLPVMQIPRIGWPESFTKDRKSSEKILFVGKLTQWLEPDKAIGIITETLGLSGALRVETQAILKEFSLNITPFTPDMLASLAKIETIPPEELSYREDLRKECIFTIDPLTARDLDDAVSVKELTNGNYEIGVHISDASFYLKESTPLDKMVSSKATTIYLVDSVYHMLPIDLCLHCSLLPGQDKLAFSVFWVMNSEGEIFSTRFVRTVMNSCTQLAYEHAQQMIENPEREFKEDELPKIFNNFTAKNLSKTVNVLQKIAVNLRKARIRNGSLRIDQIKLLFSLNPSDGEPEDFIVYENKEAHRLIEEFMLLANISVAKKISETFPDIAFLRCHEAPKYTMLLEAKSALETCGIHVDISSSRGIHSSLQKYITDDYLGFCRGMVLNHIFAKPMTRARYFCAGTMLDKMRYSHFALSVPIYTHFTSPIRRYADIMVHRLLAASLGYTQPPNWTLDYVNSIAKCCNLQKYNAKRAGEASSDLYLAHYIEKNQPYIQECVVIDVKDRSFDAIVLKTGSIVRVHQKHCEDKPSWKVECVPDAMVNNDNNNPTTNTKENKKKLLKLTLKFPKTQQFLQTQKLVVEMFSVVKVKLTRIPDTYKLEGFLLRPISTINIERQPSTSTN